MARARCISSWSTAEGALSGVHLSDAAAPPGMRIYAIGDVHGRLDLLSRLHDAIGEEIVHHAPDDWRIVHLGDYVDRGPDSRGVIDRLRRVMRTDGRFVALCGNHDIGMIDFLERADPEGLFPLYGGAETALSYGVQPDFSSAWLARQTADAMLEALPDGHLELIKGLGRSVAFGDYFFCHAGVRRRSIWRTRIPTTSSGSATSSWAGPACTRRWSSTATRQGASRNCCPIASMSTRVPMRQASSAPWRWRIDPRGSFRSWPKRKDRSASRLDDAVAIHRVMIARRVGCVDANPPQADAGEHKDGEESSFHGGHLEFRVRTSIRRQRYGLVARKCHEGIKVPTQSRQALRPSAGRIDP